MDGDWELGWRLGGSAYLLVGERHAVLVDAGGDRHTLVPAADVQDPVRARLRGLAHRLRLPAGAGLVAAAPKVKPADLTAPFTISEGGTVLDFAEKVHSDLAESLKAAKVWGSAQFDGQTVKRDHVLRDEDVVELSM